MRISGAVVISIFLLQVSGGVCRAEQPSSMEASGDQSSAHEELNRAMELGEAALAQGKYEEALKHLFRADEIEIHEIQSYNVLPKIAEARCRLGERGTGLAILQDLRCIVDVELGVLPCYVGPETRGAPGHPNPELTPLCFMRMCGEIFLSYYESPSQEQVAYVEALRLEINRVDEICSKARER